MKIKVQPAFQPISLTEQMSDEQVAALEFEMQENLEAAITNHRYSLNLETNWEGNELIKPILFHFRPKLQLQMVQKLLLMVSSITKMVGLASISNQKSLSTGKAREITYLQMV